MAQAEPLLDSFSRIYVNSAFLPVVSKFPSGASSRKRTRNSAEPVMRALGRKRSAALINLRCKNVDQANANLKKKLRKVHFLSTVSVRFYSIDSEIPSSKKICKDESKQSPKKMELSINIRTSTRKRLTKVKFFPKVVVREFPRDNSCFFFSSDILNIKK